MERLIWTKNKTGFTPAHQAGCFYANSDFSGIRFHPLSRDIIQ